MSTTHALFALATTLAAFLPTPADAGPFYWNGLRQGMTLADYNLLIDRGRYVSRPGPSPDIYLATIGAETYMVRFCRERLASLLVEFQNGASWLSTLEAAHTDGFNPLGTVVDSSRYARTKINELYVRWSSPREPYEMGARISSSVTNPDTVSFSILYFDPVLSPCGEGTTR